MDYQYSNPNDPYLNFNAILFKENASYPQTDPIPKNVHFVHTDVKELSWLDWAAVRAAIVNLQAARVNIWLPEKEELEGWIWNRVLEMPEVRIRRIVMPKKVYGAKIDTPERQNDVVRLKILYEEGGIAMDSDLVALKSSDDILNDYATRSTVMALQYRGDGIPNGLIMSKAGSPFLLRWMRQYREVKDRDNWDALSTSRPHLMSHDKDPDLTVLDGHTWFYPLSAEKNGDATLKMLWFGKTWHEIGKSYGTHFWHPKDDFASLITPKVIKRIDTPLFCGLRKLFDNLDDDGYYSTPPERNPNCSTTWTSSLKEDAHRMFSDYRMSSDDLDIQWVDSSGFNNHGWAPQGMPLQRNETSGLAVRNITDGSYAVLPVPADWDTRVWTARMTFQMETTSLAAGVGVGLFKIRMETGGEILIRIRNDNPFPGITFKFQWLGNRLAKKDYQHIDDTEWISPAGLANLKTGSHELAISFDRKEQGMISLYLDGENLGNQTLSLIASPKIGQEIWFNAQEWDNLDTGFRGTLNRFTMYADALSPDDIAKPLPSGLEGGSKLSTLSKFRPEISAPQFAASPWALLFPCVLVMLLLAFMVRRRKGFAGSIPDFVMSIPDLSKRIP